MKQGQVRIIGGKWRSRKLMFPAVPGLRPTADMVRETLFNWLTPYIVDSLCLDAFAGSGALGFEALSRGAAHVTFIDSNPTIIKYLENQSAIFATETKVEIIRTKIPNHSEFLATKFNIVFLDPPFYQGLIEPCAKWLEQSNLLEENALIYIEAEIHLDQLPIPAHWQILRHKACGEAGYFLIKR